MFKRTLGFLFLLIIAAVVTLNFKRILEFGQANEIQQRAKPAVSVQNWDKAIQIYEAGVKQYPENASVALKLAVLYQRAGKPDRAEQVYRAVLKQAPDNEEASIGLANLLQTDPKRVNEAVVELRKAVKAHPTDFRLLSEVGNLYKRAAENPAEQRPDTKKWLYEQAKYYYQTSIKENPRQFQTEFNLGVVFQNLEDMQSAAQAYCQASILVPDSYEPHYNLGVVLSELEYFDEAYRQMDRSVKILLDKGETDMAQALALKVQNIKNRIYNSGKPGLNTRPDPPFLHDKSCLVKPAPVPDADSDAAQDSH